MTTLPAQPATILAVLGNATGTDQANSGVLVRSFVIALLIMAPVAAWQWRRIKQARAAARAETADGTEVAGPRDQGEDNSLEALMESIASTVHGMAPGDSASFTAAGGLTIDGQAADPPLIDVLLRDSIARHGLQVVSVDRQADATVYRCQLR